MSTALLCMSVAVYYEARDQPIEGQIAVAQVIQKRAENRHRGQNTICGVVKDKHQFTFYWDGLKEEPKDMLALDIARYISSKVLAKEYGNICGHGKANHYHTFAVNPFWNRNMQFECIAGNHIFWSDK